jgi:hypothetical protein
VPLSHYWLVIAIDLFLASLLAMLIPEVLVFVVAEKEGLLASLAVIIERQVSQSIKEQLRV